MKNILILEDNESTLIALKEAVSKIDSKVNVYTAVNFEEACKEAFARRIDVFVIDIILETSYPGDASGMKFADVIRKHEDYLFTPIIFITALADPVFHAYRKIHCFGYLEKPFSMQEAARLVTDALRYKAPDEKGKTIWMRKDGILIAVPLCEVLYAEVRNHVLFIHMKNDLLEIPYITIKQFLKEADDRKFYQCSRNTVVNKQYIRKIDTVNRYISLSNTNSLVEIGPAFRRKFKEEILNG